MDSQDFAVNFFVALFALIDPIGNVPLFAAATAGVKNKDSRLIAVFISLFVLGFLTFFYFTGLSLLAFFGISLPAFRIAGGIILFLLGLEMARDDFTATFASAAEGPETEGRGNARRRFERMIVPFAMPLLIGPGFLLGYLAGRMTLAQTVARLGQKAGVKAAAVVSAYGLAAVDVDKPSDLDLVRTLI